MKWKVSLTQLMALIVVLAVGLAAMKVATEWAVGCVLLGSVLVLLVAMTGAIVRQRRAPWVGFSLFAWGYVLVLAITTYIPVQIRIAVPDNAIGTSSLFQIDRLTWNFANGLHHLPYPQEPFDYHQVWDHSTIPYTWKFKKVDTSNQFTIDLTPQETKLAEDHSSRMNAYHQSLMNVAVACWIGLAFQGLAFASLGAVVGQLLDRGNS